MSKPDQQSGKPPGKAPAPPMGTPPGRPKGTPPASATPAGTPLPGRPPVERAPAEKAGEKPKPLGPLSSRKSGRAVALKYDQDSGAPIVVASGMGYMAERMVEVAEDNGVPIFEDTSLATVLTQLQLGQQIPPELYKAIVDIYIYFLRFDASDPDKLARERAERKKEKQAEEKARAAQEALEKKNAKEGELVEVSAEVEEPPREKTAEELMAELYDNN